MKLKDKVSLVTGGGQGIGKAICSEFGREGSSVVVVDVSSEKANEVSAELLKDGCKSLAVSVDVSSSSAVNDMVDRVLCAFQKIDILVNAAGVIIGKTPIEDLKEEDWDRVMAINLKGTFLCSQSVGRHMIKDGGGCIINVASVGAYAPQIYAGAYSPSKAGVLLLTRLMSVEWAKHNIRVNTISPGSIDTPMLRSVFNTDELMRARARSVPMNRFGAPEEIAKTAVFLASDEVCYITGHSLVIDGGSLNNMFYTAGLLLGK